MGKVKNVFQIHILQLKKTRIELSFDLAVRNDLALYYALRKRDHAGFCGKQNEL